MIIIYYRFEKNSRNENDALAFFFPAFVPLVRSLCRGALAGMHKKQQLCGFPTESTAWLLFFCKRMKLAQNLLL